MHIGDEVIFFNSGTPQGSIISPILFDLYINDLLLEIEKEKRVKTIKAFADDIMIVCDGRMDVRRYIKKFKDWAGKNHMMINEKKS